MISTADQPFIQVSKAGDPADPSDLGVSDVEHRRMLARVLAFEAQVLRSKMFPDIDNED